MRIWGLRPNTHGMWRIALWSTATLLASWIGLLWQKDHKWRVVKMQRLQNVLKQKWKAHRLHSCQLCDCSHRSGGGYEYETQHLNLVVLIISGWYSRAQGIVSICKVLRSHARKGNSHRHPAFRLFEGTDNATPCRCLVAKTTNWTQRKVHAL